MPIGFKHRHMWNSVDNNPRIYRMAYGNSKVFTIIVVILFLIWIRKHTITHTYIRVSTVRSINVKKKKHKMYANNGAHGIFF